MTKTITKAIGYARVSTGEQESIPDQIEWITQTAHQKHIELVAIYSEVAHRDTLEGRPVMQKLLQDIQNGSDVDCIIAFRLDRISGSIEDAIKIEKILRKAGIEYIITSEGLFQPGSLLTRLKWVISEDELRIIKQRQRLGIERIKREGKLTGGIPDGYKYDPLSDVNPVIDKERAPIVLEVLNTYLKYPPTKAVKVLNEKISEGIVPKKAKVWTVRILQRYVSQKRLYFYAGKRLYNDEIIECEWQPLIDDEFLEKLLVVKMMRKGRGTSQLHYDNKPKYLLTGMGKLICGYCGHAMSSHKSVRKRKDGSVRVDLYYICPSLKGLWPCKATRFHQMKRIDDLVLEAVFKRFIKVWKHKREALKRSLLAENQSIKAESERIMQEINRLKEENTKYIEAIKTIKHLRAIKQIAKKIESNERRIISLENTHKDLLAKLHGIHPKTQILDIANLTLDNFNVWSLERKKTFLNAILYSIRVYDTYIKVYPKWLKSFFIIPLSSIKKNKSKQGL